VADPFGPEFFKALGKELDDLSQPQSDRGKDRPTPQGEPRFKLRGAPGSPERLQQVAELTPDPSLIAELAWGSVGTHLQNTLHQIRAYEDSDYFDGTYPQEIAEAFASSARMLASAGDPQLYAAFEHELGEESPLVEYLAPAVQQAETQGRIENYELGRAQEEQRMEAREQTLNREYADIQRRTGPAGIAAADQLAQNLDQQGLLYHPNADEDLLRAQLRSTAETVKAQERGLNTAAFLTELDTEIARNYGPGSSWNDQEREEWERELRQGTVETVQRAFGDPADHADRAISGMIEDDARAKTGKGAFQRALDHHLDEHNSHARQNSPHLRALAEANFREWERTHDESGYPTTETDGLGHEHRRRGSPDE
jgi:hypothetical protein